MGAISIISNEKDFSFIVEKNPLTGMTAKAIRKGYAFGYYSSENRYNVVFFDDADEISFAKKMSQEFEYLDYTRYNSPVIVSNILKTFFSGALGKVKQYDHTGDYTLYINSMEVKRFNKVMSLLEYFDDFYVTFNKLKHEPVDEEEYYNNYSITINVKNKTFHQLLNFTYLFVWFIAKFDSVEMEKTIDIVKKMVKAANIISAPYYIKYMIKFLGIRKNEEFNQIKEEINKDKNHKLNISPFENQFCRYSTIASQITHDKAIVDVGCGEGMYTRLAEKNPNTYYAIDIDEKARQSVERRIKRDNLKNVVVLKSVEDFFLHGVTRDYIVILSEVFEHNEKEYMDRLFKTFFKDKHCKKLLITTPNKDFNKFYHLKDDEMRHPDHKFEMNKEETESYFENLLKDTNFEYSLKNIGDEVDDISTTLLVVIKERTENGV